MERLTVDVWTLGEAAGYRVKRGDLEIVLCASHVRDVVIQEAKRLAFICNADFYLNGVFHHPQLTPKRPRP